jgi:hypothetical protein
MFGIVGDVLLLITGASGVGKSTIRVAAPSAPQLDAVAVCLLDASAEAQAERLAARGDDPALLVHHQAFAEWMRHQAIDPLHMLHVVSDQGWDEMRWERLERLAGDWRMHTIDTSLLSRVEVADLVLQPAAGPEEKRRRVGSASATSLISALFTAAT